MRAGANGRGTSGGFFRGKNGPAFSEVADAGAEQVAGKGRDSRGAGENRPSEAKAVPFQSLGAAEFFRKL